jgi:hypothetical protein
MGHGSVLPLNFGRYQRVPTTSPADSGRILLTSPG